MNHQLPQQNSSIIAAYRWVVCTLRHQGGSLFTRSLKAVALAKTAGTQLLLCAIDEHMAWDPVWNLVQECGQSKLTPKK